MKFFNRNSVVLMFLALIFITPGIFALIYFKYPQLQIGGTTNSGTFVKPAYLLPELGADKKWTIILWRSTRCDDECIKTLDKIGRVRLALGRHLYEVNLLLLLGADAASVPAENASLLKDNGVDIVKSSRLEMTSIVHNDNTIFLANPDDYLVLSYAESSKPDAIFHDLKHLLSTSKK